MSEHQIMIIRVNQRQHSADKLQKVFSTFGCSIKTRLGLHEAGDVCATDGLIVLQMVKGNDDLDDFVLQLNALDGVTAKLVEI
jgi:hypothetical protein